MKNNFIVIRDYLINMNKVLFMSYAKDTKNLVIDFGDTSICINDIEDTVFLLIRSLLKGEDNE